MLVLVAYLLLRLRVIAAVGIKRRWSNNLLHLARTPKRAIIPCNPRAQKALEIDVSKVFQGRRGEIRVRPSPSSFNVSLYK